MITILALILAAYLIYKNWESDVFGWLGNIGFSLIILFVITIVTGMIWLAASNWKVEVSRTDCNSPIYSLKNVNDIEGTFCLGSGYINSQEYYYMFQKFGDGGLRRISLRSADSVLFQNENVNPHFSWQQIHYRLPYLVLWPNITKFQIVNDSMYYIYVPSNSVVLRFNVD